MPAVHRVVGNLCMFDMMQEDGQGRARVKKATGFMTHSVCIAERLQVKCNELHRHFTLVSGRAKAAEVYPDKLCSEVVRGLVEQMDADGRISRGSLGSIAAFDKEDQAFFGHENLLCAMRLMIPFSSISLLGKVMQRPSRKGVKRLYPVLTVPTAPRRQSPP